MSPSYFVETFCWLQQKASAGVSERDSILPFQMGNSPEESHFFQRRILNWLHNRENVLTLKSRRVGCSWVAAAYAAWMVNFHKNVNILFISRNGAEAKKILAKVKFILKNLAYHDSDDLRKATRTPWLCGELVTDNLEQISIGYRDDSGEVVMTSDVVSLNNTDDAARGDDATFIVFDELAFYEHPEETWSSAQKTLARGGHWMAIACVALNTYIFTEYGIEQIGDYLPSSTKHGEFGEIDTVKIHGRYGLKPCNTVYNSGITYTTIVTTDRNYRLESTAVHPILCMRDGNIDWIKTHEIKIGDWVPIQYGMNCWGKNTSLTDCIPDRYFPSHGKEMWVPPNNITEDLAYLLGLITGDGHLSDGLPYRVNIATVDKQTKQWLLGDNIGLDFSESSNPHHIVASSKSFIDFCRKFGMSIGVRAPSKKIPDRIMKSPQNIVRAFLQGLFDADGSSSRKNGGVQFTSTSIEMINQVRALLLNFGIISSLFEHITKPTKRVKVESLVYILEIGIHAREFYSLIGFRLDRKQNNSLVLKNKSKSLKDKIPFAALLVNPIRKKLPQLRGMAEFSRDRRTKSNRATVKQAKKYPFALSKQRAREILELYPEAKDRYAYRKLNELVSLPYYWVQVKSIEYGQRQTCDFHIPDGNSFITNGFVSHNTPNGVGDVFHRMTEQGDLCEAGHISEEELGFKYIKIHWSEAGITQEQVNKSNVGSTQEKSDQEWEFKFISPGSAVFHPTHLAACYKPPEQYPEVAKALAEYREEVAKLDGNLFYYSGADTIVGKKHKKSREKDFNAFVALTKSGIQAFCHMGQEPLSQWAGMTLDGEEIPGMVPQLHAEWPGMLQVEENGPGYTVINRYQPPPDIFSMMTPVSMSAILKRGAIERLIVLVESHGIVITDLRLYQQMQVFEQIGPGQYSAPQGYHDDLVIALALAVDALQKHGSLAFPWGDNTDKLERASITGMLGQMGERTVLGGGPKLDILTIPSEHLRSSSIFDEDKLPSTIETLPFENMIGELMKDVPRMPQ